jgi:hypothetical protein
VSKKAIAIAAVLFAAIPLILFKEPLLLEWHKWRLQSAKEKYRRLLNDGMTTREKVWSHLTGKPIPTQHLKQVWKKHEDVLVQTGFLQREEYVSPGGHSAAFNQAIDEMEREFRWWSMLRESDTNLIVTACTGGMDKWRERAKEFGLIAKRLD